MGTTTRTTQAARGQADVCLYGNPDLAGTGRRKTGGAGYLGVIYPHGQSFGTGEPVEGRTYTEAIWAAQDELRALGIAGFIHLYDAGGERMAVIGIHESVTYGKLTWHPAPVYTVSVEALLAAAEPVR